MPFTVDLLLERLAVDEFHYQVRQPAGPSTIFDGIDRDDVIVTDGRGCLRLPGEPLAGGRIRGQFRSEDLDGDDAIQLGIVRLEDDPHPAPSDRFEHFVLAQPPERARPPGRFEEVERNLVDVRCCLAVDASLAGLVDGVGEKFGGSDINCRVFKKTARISMRPQEQFDSLTKFDVLAALGVEKCGSPMIRLLQGSVKDIFLFHFALPARTDRPSQE